MTPRVLVVDDLPFMRTLLTDILVDAGMEIAGEAENGRQALSYFLAVDSSIRVNNSAQCRRQVG
ncbi:MAG: response regulator [Spirochaetales bacterium]|nr:MAG: response regulator [Spirochaetales bacterium]